jgi:hypothetical protein
MAATVPTAARRDLRTPAYLRLDEDARFPRLIVTTAPPRSLPGHHGPFRDRENAVRVRDALNRRAGLRPCDHVFEPDPALPLGLGCVHAQVRTCAAPCLLRLDERAYRARGREVARWLADPETRPADLSSWLPPWVADAAGETLVVEAGQGGVELYPVRAGAVLEERAARVAVEGLEAAVQALSWAPCLGPRDDSRWLSAWLHAPRRRGRLIPVADAPRSRLAGRVLEALEASGR